MEIIDLKDEEKWHQFLLANSGESGSEFLMSSAWAGILVGENKTIKCLAALDEKQSILGLIFLIKKSLGGRFYYWYGPRGPIFKSGLSNQETEFILNLFISAIKKIDTPINKAPINKKAVFLKIEPAQSLNGFWQANGGFGKPAGLNLKIAAPIQPKKTLILDLQKTETELLKEMHQKTRYNINLAAKKEVQIIEGGAEDFSEFWRLMELTGARDGFRIHDKEHYKNLISGPEDVQNGGAQPEDVQNGGAQPKDVQNGGAQPKGEDKNKFIKLFFAVYQGHKIATALTCSFGNKVTYLHGASDNEFRNIMAPYLLQWEIIKRAQADGALIYDFYGIDEKKWPGVTRFKLGFGGEERNYPGVFEIVFKPLIYNIYNLAKRIKKILK